MIKYGTAESKQGFTLIELSIVLVIIGLIVGGVLVGQDLIKAAQVRATVAQYEKYNTAVNTFRTKYNYIPGDLCSGTCATGLGFVTRASDSTNGLVNNNKLLETVGSGADASATIAGNETVLFWRDLSTASLIDGNFSTATDAVAASLTASTVRSYFPAAKLGPTNYFAVWNDGSFNYYELTGIASTDGSGAYTLSGNLTPQDSMNIDTKIDDGKPGTGVILGNYSTSTFGTAVSYSATVCATAATAYNTTSTYASSPLCQLQMRFN